MTLANACLSNPMTCELAGNRTTKIDEDIERRSLQVRTLSDRPNTTSEDDRPEHPLDEVFICVGGDCCEEVVNKRGYVERSSGCLRWGSPDHDMGGG